MERFLGRYTPQLFAVLRFMAGAMFFLHGSDKIFGFPGGKMGSLPPIATVAGWIELIAGFLIAIGLFGSLAAFIASGEMAVAYWMGHALKDGTFSFWPTVNKGELAALYCFLFLFIAAHGSGIWSVDHAMRRGRGSSRA